MIYFLTLNAPHGASRRLSAWSVELLTQSFPLRSSHAQEAAAELLRVGALEKSRLSLVDFNRTTEVTTVQKISCHKNMKVAGCFSRMFSVGRDVLESKHRITVTFFKLTGLHRVSKQQRRCNSHAKSLPGYFDLRTVKESPLWVSCPRALSAICSSPVSWQC
jgi:hypothetical protein